MNNSPNIPNFYCFLNTNVSPYPILCPLFYSVHTVLLNYLLHTSKFNFYYILMTFKTITQIPFLNSIPTTKQSAVPPEISQSMLRATRVKWNWPFLFSSVFSFIFPHYLRHKYITKVTYKPTKMLLLGFLKFFNEPLF